MKRLAISLSALLVSSVAVVAADDPIAVRQSLMQAVAGAAGASGGMLKGEIDYNPVVAKAAIATLYGVSQAYGDYFPEGSQNGDTDAAPEIWEDMEGFHNALADFQADAAAAFEAAGKDGPADLAAFKAAVQPVLSNCRDCHESFRIQDD
ncbi:cytochrome c [Chelativorans sp. M5D2P16]|uniref:c-type cytochrome n=1 Tax=Chelativorans sp. M5D2P16 TaxID=3095678 RepID=UPI002ACABC17|nr:cytochrome c [Chelativorans sp. M5D2P16]MDZ5698385.1 cytochrome c [Chelativorans sp. M5D2P16]